MATKSVWMLVGVSCFLGMLLSNHTARGDQMGNAVHPPMPAPEFRAETSILPSSYLRPPQAQEAVSRGYIGRTEPVARRDIQCNVPEVEIPLSPSCGEGMAYPRCRWRMPHPEMANDLFIQWRNTTHDHLWGRADLVRLILTTAREYYRHYPDEPLVVGDLDAPGPRHRTHRTGVNVDLYLPDSMATRNEGPNEYPDNYSNRPPHEVAERRARVESLARILSVCSGGSAGILYNDEPVKSSFREWYEAEGFSSAFGSPMRSHNRLHLFHFHVTIPESLPEGVLTDPGTPSPQDQNAQNDVRVLAPRPEG